MDLTDPAEAFLDGYRSALGVTAIAVDSLLTTIDTLDGLGIAVDTGQILRGITSGLRAASAATTLQEAGNDG